MSDISKFCIKARYVVMVTVVYCMMYDLRCFQFAYMLHMVLACFVWFSARLSALIWSLFKVVYAK